ncbi:unnamed protein product, partial [Rotaria socialis]
VKRKQVELRYESSVASIIIGFFIDNCTDRGSIVTITVVAIAVQKIAVNTIHKSVCLRLRRTSSSGIKATRPGDVVTRPVP